MSSTIRFALSAWASTSRFTARSPTRFSSWVSSSVSNQCNVEVSAAPRSSALAPDETKRRVRRHAHRVVEVFIAREPAVDRLPQEIRQAELRVQSLSGVAQVLGDECLQPQALIQLAHQKETGTLFRSELRAGSRARREIPRAVSEPDPRSVQTVTDSLASHCLSTTYGHHRPPTPMDTKRSISDGRCSLSGAGGRRVERRRA